MISIVSFMLPVEIKVYPANGSQIWRMESRKVSMNGDGGRDRTISLNQRNGGFVKTQKCQHIEHALHI